MAFAIIDDSAMSEKTWSGKGYDWQPLGAVMYSRATVHVSKRLLLTAQIDKGPSTRKSGRFCAVPVADHRPGLCGLYGGSSRALSARLNRATQSSSINTVHLLVDQFKIPRMVVAFEVRIARVGR